MSFKYRFILSFVSLEIFFIILIVSINFFAINSSSKQLTNEKIESNISFLDELVKVPISIYDLATLDNIITNTSALKYINSIVILDNQNRIVSSQYNFKYKKIDQIIDLKDNKHYAFSGNTFELKYNKIYEGEIFLGSMYIIFDTTENSHFIKDMKSNTFYLIFLEIFISTLLSYLIGSNLTKKLTKLSHIAEEIGNDNITEIPFIYKKDEIGILSNSLNKMQIDLKNRNQSLKKLTKDLKKQKAELIETQKYKDAFFANVSHELKTPLNSINILSSIMKKNKEGNLSQSQVKNMQIINNCGKSLLSLINDILDISKLEAKEFILEIEKLDFELYVYEIKEMIEAQIKENNLNLIFSYDKNIQYILNDRKCLNQIIINLLSNAVKFTQEGNVEFRIIDRGDFIEIIVRDEGIGIAQDKLEHIFDRFKQVDGSTSRKYGGTGLGLSICKELVALLHGNIKVKSELGKGTQFIVQIQKNLTSSPLYKTKEILHLHKDANVIKNKKEVKNITNNIFILHNEPIKFFDIVVELKRKKKNIISINNLSEISDKMIASETYNLVLDLELVDEEDLKNICKLNSNINLYLMCNNKEMLSKELVEISSAIFEKPINKTDLFSVLL